MRVTNSIISACRFITILYYHSYKQVERLKLSTSEKFLRITKGFLKKFIDRKSNCIHPVWKPLLDFEQYLVVFILPTFLQPSQPQRGTAVAQWLRRYATNRKVGGSNLAGVIGIIPIALSPGVD